MLRMGNGEGEDDDYDDADLYDPQQLAQLRQIKAMAEAMRQRGRGFGPMDNGEDDEYEDDEDYGEDDQHEQGEDDDEEDVDAELDEAARMMLMMEEQEKLYLHQQMLEREYLKAAANAGQHPINGSTLPTVAQLKMLQNHMDELEDDLVDEKIVANGGVEDEEDDLILAGAAVGAAPTES